MEQKTSDPKASSEAETTAIATARAAAIGKPLSLETGELRDNESPMFEKGGKKTKMPRTKKNENIKTGSKDGDTTSSSSNPKE